MWKLAATVAALALATSCTGAIADPASTEEGTGGRAETSCGTFEVLPDLPLRRLSVVEYQNTLRDVLFGLELTDAPELPADVREHGFENVAAQLSAPPLLVERQEIIATMAAEAAMTDAPTRAQLLPCSGWDTAAAQDACTDAFLSTFGRRAFRRPLTADERADFTAFVRDVTGRIDYEAAIELAIAALMQSPQFVYRVETGDSVPSAYDVASRLSYFLWQSMPDDVLLDAAEAGELSTPEELEAQARRMLAMPAARAAMIDFHRQWLDFDRVVGEPKNPAQFPAWSDGLRAAIREEADRFVGSVLFDRDPTVRALLTDRTAWVDAELAAHYGLDPVSGWTEVQLPAGERAGILTRAAFLAGRAHETNGSPVLRGAFVIDRLLCRELGSPPDDADTSPVVPDESAGPQTNRMLFEQRTSPTQCQGCHSQIDGIGYGFEAYDATGAFRTTDNTLPVDATGTLLGTDVDGPYDGAIEISERLGESTVVERCVAQSWVRYSLGRATQRADDCLLERARDALERSGGDLRELMVSIVTSPELQRGQP
jgi:hypothetical protein